MEESKMKKRRWAPLAWPRPWFRSSPRRADVILLGQTADYSGPQAGR